MLFSPPTFMENQEARGRNVVGHTPSLIETMTPLPLVSMGLLCLFDALELAKMMSSLEKIPFLKSLSGSSYCGSMVTNLTRIHEDVGSIPGLTQWVRDLVLP